MSCKNGAALRAGLGRCHFSFCFLPGSSSRSARWNKRVAPQGRRQQRNILNIEDREIRTPNLLIWSQTRCHCAISPMQKLESRFRTGVFVQWRLPASFLPRARTAGGQAEQNAGWRSRFLLSIQLYNQHPKFCILVEWRSG